MREDKLNRPQDQLRVNLPPIKTSPLSPLSPVSVLQHRGEIHLILGPMFSGKTRDLKRRVDVKRIACNKTNTRCLLIKYKKDTRYHSTAMVTHNNIHDYDAVAADDLVDVMQIAQQADFLFIDEGQFFPSTCT